MRGRKRTLRFPEPGWVCADPLRALASRRRQTDRQTRQTDSSDPRTTQRSLVSESKSECSFFSTLPPIHTHTTHTQHEATRGHKTSKKASRSGKPKGPKPVRSRVRKRRRSHSRRSGSAKAKHPVRGPCGGKWRGELVLRVACRVAWSGVGVGVGWLVGSKTERILCRA